MNPPKADELDYIHFLIAAQNVFTCTEAARSAPEAQNPPAHDAFTRLLRRYWATDDIEMGESDREELEGSGWGIETYHRALKQCCGVERSQARGERAQRNHLGLSLRAV